MSLVDDAMKKLRSAADASRSTKPVASVDRSTQKPRPAGDDATLPPPSGSPRIIGDPAKKLRLDFEVLRQQGLIGPADGDRQIARQFRTVKRPLIEQAFEDESAPGQEQRASKLRRFIMISSPLQGDGKTFTAVNLALSLAREPDYSVLLIDADVLKPRLSRLLGIEQSMGLVDALADSNLPVESLIMPTDVSHLSVLPVGRNSESVTDLLSSSRMRELVTEIQALDSRLLVVVDSPPMLLTSESRVLASLFGQIVLVVRSGVTPQQAVIETLHMLGDGTAVQLLLNEAIHGTAASYYGYEYGDAK